MEFSYYGILTVLLGIFAVFMGIIMACDYYGAVFISDLIPHFRSAL
jgi:hypothetical protein